MKNRKTVPIIGIVVLLLVTAGSIFLQYVERNTGPEMTMSGKIYTPGTEAPRPKATQDPMAGISLGRQNAIKSAQSYLRYSSFSRKGLIDQLRFEGYTTDEATYAVDYLEPDWYAEAAESAASYLKYSSFSRQGLIDQLVFEGFTQDEAEYGVAAAGY